MNHICSRASSSCWTCFRVSTRWLRLSDVIVCLSHQRECRDMLISAKGISAEHGTFSRHFLPPPASLAIQKAHASNPSAHASSAGNRARRWARANLVVFRVTHQARCSRHQLMLGMITIALCVGLQHNVVRHVAIQQLYI